MSVAFIPDLEASRNLLCAVTIRTATGDKMLTGVKDLNEDDEYVVVYDPQDMGDTHTTRTLLLSDIVSVTLMTDVGYKMGRDQP